MPLVKFGDIAKHISNRVDPSKTDLKIYVGLEHLDPGSLRIKRHGIPSDVDGQKLLVKKGQIIFGKRRAYQRKVAVADWDCICSAHAMVLEANEENILPEFLPFFMLSDVFMNRAIDVSEGSLSPTIKWKVLATQSFILPSLKDQAKSLELLNKALTNTIKARELFEYVEAKKTRLAYDLILKGNWFEELFGKEKCTLPKGWKLVKIADVLSTVQYGLSDAVHENGHYPILRMMNITNGYVDPNNLKYINLQSNEAEKFLLKKGDILFNRTNSMD